MMNGLVREINERGSLKIMSNLKPVWPAESRKLQRGIRWFSFGAKFKEMVKNTNRKPVLEKLESNQNDKQ